MSSTSVTRLFVALACLALLYLTFQQKTFGATHDNMPLSLVTPLAVFPGAPSAGQPVTARFAVRNDGGTPVTLNRIGAGGRGPGCADFGCDNFQDFPLLSAVTIDAGQTFTYEQQRSFAAAGPYFFQISYEAPAGAWSFLGDRVDVPVGRGLELSRPLSLTPADPTTKDLVLAEFEVLNAGAAPVSFLKLGVGLRGPDCTLGDWGCLDRPDYPFAENVTIGPGQRYAFREWRTFVTPGAYFARVSLQDMSGAWNLAGERIDFAVGPAAYTSRTEPLRFGVQWHPTWDKARDDEELGLAASVGAEVIRIGASWRMLEPAGKGQWDAWYTSQLDRLIRQANSLGIEVYLMLLEVPCWASSDPGKDCTSPNPGNECKAGTWDCAWPPARTADYADALRKLVALYGNRVKVWEVWNEPNVARFWKPAPDAGAYTVLLKEAYTAIKSVQPDATVLGASLAGADYEFLDAMYMAGAQGYFDALALHPYTSGAPGDCVDVRWSYACGIDGIRSLMLRYGDDKDMWLTEFGWATYAAPWGVTEAVQRDYLMAALRELDWRGYVKAVSWYTLVNTAFVDLPPDRPHDNDFGLFERSHRPKPAAQWLQVQQWKQTLFLPMMWR